ncbi:MAG: hypothetical protein QW146_03745 [Candidatus Bathyarchaeia archaeon]
MTPNFNFYDWYYWCTQCSRWISKNTAVPDIKGSPCCTNCGKRLRTKPLCSYRNKKAKTNHKTSTPGSITTPWHSPILGAPIPQGSNPRPSKTPPKSHVAKTMIPQTSSDFQGNPSNCNGESRRSMEAWKK